MVSVDRGKSQQVLNYVREYQEGYLTVFWFETGQKEFTADALDDGGDESYLNLEFFLPDALTVDVIVTTRHVRAVEITMLTAVEIEETGITETTEFSQKYAKLQYSLPNQTPTKESTADRDGIKETRANDYTNGIVCRYDSVGRFDSIPISQTVRREV
jgi:hypothetical protein